MAGTTTTADRYGLPMSTRSRAAADHYVEGVDLLLSQNFGSDEAFTKAMVAE